MAKGEAGLEPRSTRVRHRARLHLRDEVVATPPPDSTRGQAQGEKAGPQAGAAPRQLRCGGRAQGPQDAQNTGCHAATGDQDRECGQVGGHEDTKLRCGRDSNPEAQPLTPRTARSCPAPWLGPAGGPWPGHHPRQLNLTLTKRPSAVPSWSEAAFKGTGAQPPEAGLASLVNRLDGQAATVPSSGSGPEWHPGPCLLPFSAPENPLLFLCEPLIHRPPDTQGFFLFAQGP